MRTSLAQILMADVIDAPYDSDRFALDPSLVKIGEVVHVQETDAFYLVRDLANLDNNAGYLAIAIPVSVTQITGTPGQVAINGSYNSPQVGPVTISLPQDIDTVSTPIFGGLTLNGELNGLTIIPTSGANLSIASGKTLDVQNSMTLMSADGASVNFGAGGTIAYAGSVVDQITGTANQVVVNGTVGVPQVGPVTLALPQDIAPTSNVTFNQVATPSALIGTLNVTSVSSTGAIYTASFLRWGSDTAGTSGQIGNIAGPNTVFDFKGSLAFRDIDNALVTRLTINSSGITAGTINCAELFVTRPLGTVAEWSTTTANGLIQRFNVNGTQIGAIGSGDFVVGTSTSDFAVRASIQNLILRAAGEIQCSSSAAAAKLDASGFHVTGVLEASATILGPAPTAALSTIRLPHGVTPTTPADGDMWTTTTGLFIRINGLTVGPLSGAVAAGVTSITGTAGEITASAATGAVTLSIPASVIFTGKTITGGTYLSGAFNGTMGATTPNTGSFTALTATGLVDFVGAATPKVRIGDGTRRIEIGWSAGLSSNYIESMNPGGGSVDMAYYMGGNTAHRFYVSGTEVIRITSTGLQGAIGATTPNTGAFTSLSATTRIVATDGVAIGNNSPSGFGVGAIYGSLADGLVIVGHSGSTYGLRLRLFNGSDVMWTLAGANTAYFSGINGPIGVSGANFGIFTTVTATGNISAANFSGTFAGTHSGTSSGTNTGDQTSVSGSAGWTKLFMSTSHDGTYWLVNNWDGAYWSITSNHGAPARVGFADVSQAGSLTGGTLAAGVTAASLNTINPSGGTLSVGGALACSSNLTVSGSTALFGNSGAAGRFAFNGLNGSGQGSLLVIRTNGADKAYIGTRDAIYGGSATDLVLRSVSENVYIDAASANVATFSPSGLSVVGAISGTQLVATGGGDGIQAAIIQTTSGRLTVIPFFDSTYGALLDSTNPAGSVPQPLTFIGSVLRHRINGVNITTTRSNGLFIGCESAFSVGAGTQDGISCESSGLINISRDNGGVIAARRRNGDGNLFVFYRDLAGVGGIQVTTTSTVYATTSDGRLKTNIRDYTGEDSGPIMDALRPRRYDWKSGQTDHVGFIAQELNEVDPLLARIGAVTVGDSNPTDITDQWQRSDQALVPILVAEIKSLRARVAQLEAA